MFKNKYAFMGFLVLSLSLTNCSRVSFQLNSPGNNNSATGVTTPTPSAGPVTYHNLSASGMIAYNDNYPLPGDSDYNDFVVDVNAVETYDNSGNLNQIVVTYTPKYKISGIDHQFVLGFDGNIRGRGGFVSNLSNTQSLAMFEGAATIDVQVVDSNGNIVSQESNHDKSTDLIIYPSTLTAMSQNLIATITVTNIDAHQNNSSTRGAVTLNRYRTVLFNGGYDIDISQIDPQFLDQSGAPPAFFVPLDFRPPGEAQSIFIAYPEFGAHAAYLQSGAPLDAEPANSAQWYNTIANANILLP